MHPPPIPFRPAFGRAIPSDVFCFGLPHLSLGPEILVSPTVAVYKPIYLSLENPFLTLEELGCLEPTASDLVSPFRLSFA